MAEAGQWFQPPVSRSQACLRSWTEAEQGLLKLALSQLAKLEEHPYLKGKPGAQMAGWESCGFSLVQLLSLSQSSFLSFLRLGPQQ